MLSIRFPNAVFLLSVWILSVSLGCSLGKPLRPLTPSQLFSGELSRAGNAALEKGNWAEAEKKLEEAVKLNKKDAELRRHYAEALWIRGKKEESLKQLDEAVRQGGNDDVSLHISMAEKYLAIDEPQTAYNHADEAIRLAPKEYKAWAIRGKAAWYLAEQNRRSIPFDKFVKELHQAKNDYYRALSLSPNNREILPELAVLQTRQGEPEHSLATWQNLQELFPPETEPVEILRGKAEAYVALGRYDEAVFCLQTAKRRSPESPVVDQRLQEVFALVQGTVNR